MVEGTPLLREHAGINLHRGFESLLLRQGNNFYAPVAQLDRVLGYEPRGQEFESLRAHQQFNGLGQKWSNPFFFSESMGTPVGTPEMRLTAKLGSNYAIY